MKRVEAIIPFGYFYKKITVTAFLQFGIRFLQNGFPYSGSPELAFSGKPVFAKPQYAEVYLDYATK